jgi:hypothetical protein
MRYVRQSLLIGSIGITQFKNIAQATIRLIGPLACNISGGKGQSIKPSFYYSVPKALSLEKYAAKFDCPAKQIIATLDQLVYLVGKVRTHVNFDWWLIFYSCRFSANHYKIQIKALNRRSNGGPNCNDCHYVLISLC